jgi:PTH2 family peptidyl-tRNA hydrolase
MSDDERRMVIHIRNDAHMSPGKAAAQAVHAALMLVGAHPGTPVIVLGASKRRIEECEVVVRDAGRTEVAPGTVTAGASFEPRRDPEPTDLSATRARADKEAAK